MIPVVSPHTALGIAVGQEIHDQTCGSSPATAMARASRYFHFSPSAGNLFKSLQGDCFKCRRIRMIRGRDLINPLRHLSHASMVPGLSLQLNVAGPFLVFTKSKQSTQETRQEKRVKRTTTKMWLLLAIDYFTSRLEFLPLEDMTTEALSSAIQDIITSTGWSTRRIPIDPGSSLVTTVEDTSGAVADLQDQADDHQDPTVTAQQNRDLIKGLMSEGFEIKKPFSKRSQSQSKVESIIKSFKICLKASQIPGSWKRWEKWTRRTPRQK